MTNAPLFIHNENIHKDLQIIKIVNHIRALSKNFYNAIFKSSGSLHYTLHIHLLFQRRLKRDHSKGLFS